MMKDSSHTKLPFGLLELDSNGAVIRYSPASEQHSDMKAGDVLGRHFFSEVLPDEHQNVRRENDGAEIQPVLKIIQPLNQERMRVRSHRVCRKAVGRRETLRKRSTW